jgi:hypothetical protein
MTVKVRVDSEFALDLVDQCVDTLADKLYDALNDAADILLRHMREAVSLVGHPIRGAPPRLRTKELRDSLHKKAPEIKGAHGRIEVGTLLVWAARVHWGGADKTGRRIAPHPFIAEAEDAAREEINELFRERFGL